MDKFSLDLAAECRPHGIVVQSVLPGYVATKLPGLSGKVSFDVPTPEYYVAAALRSVGVETRTAAHWFHKILVSFLNKKIRLLYLTISVLTAVLAGVAILFRTWPDPTSDGQIHGTESKYGDKKMKINEKKMSETK